MTFICRVRYYKTRLDSIKDAVDLAIKECIQEGILADFLRKHRGDVMSNCITEFNEEVYRIGLLEEGREEGRMEGERSVIEKMFKKGMDAETIAGILGVSAEEVEDMLKTVNNK